MAHSKLSGRPFGLIEKRERRALANRVWMDTVAGGPNTPPPVALADAPEVEVLEEEVEPAPPVKKPVAKKKVVTAKKTQSKK